MRTSKLRLTQLALTSMIAFAALSAPPEAEAFCGFYVAGADAKLYNNATMVVMMRDGQRTVLAMQNNYQGPPENFAMVVPVPVVLMIILYAIAAWVMARTTWGLHTYAVGSSERAARIAGVLQDDRLADSGAVA